MSAPYGYRTGDTRHVLVHVVAEEGWTDRPVILGRVHQLPEAGAWALCGAGLNQEAGYPGEEQKWCGKCTDPVRREIERTRF